MQAAGCTGLDALNPVCQVGSLGGSLAASGFESVLNGISQWVASGGEWLLGQIGGVLASTTSIDVGATWFRTHYGQMTALAGVVILPMLLVSTLQAVLRQNPGQLVRTYLLQLPLALLLAVVAIQVVIMSLSATDAMSDAVAGGTGADVASLLTTLTKALVAAAADPTIASFVLLLVGLLVAVAAFVLWLELLIRVAAVYVAVLFLPLALATLVWPAVSHWCRRLVETLAALILSKFVIVATLSLAASAVSSGASGAPNSGGFSAVLGGGALLVMATFVPFAILRLIPAIEAGAVGHLEGLHQRGISLASLPARSAANHALHGGLEAIGDALAHGADRGGRGARSRRDRLGLGLGLGRWRWRWWWRRGQWWWWCGVRECVGPPEHRGPGGARQSLQRRLDGGSRRSRRRRSVFATDLRRGDGGEHRATAERTEADPRRGWRRRGRRGPGAVAWPGACGRRVAGRLERRGTAASAGAPRTPAGASAARRGRRGRRGRRWSRPERGRRCVEVEGRPSRREVLVPRPARGAPVHDR